MSYYFSKKLRMPFNSAIEHVTQALASKGFGILTMIDVRATMKKKLDVDFRSYTILGAAASENPNEYGLASVKTLWGTCSTKVAISA